MLNRRHAEEVRTCVCTRVYMCSHVEMFFYFIRWAFMLLMRVCVCVCELDMRGQGGEYSAVYCILFYPALLVFSLTLPLFYSTPFYSIWFDSIWFPHCVVLFSILFYSTLLNFILLSLDISSASLCGVKPCRSLGYGWTVDRRFWISLRTRRGLQLFSWCFLVANQYFDSVAWFKTERYNFWQREWRISNYVVCNFLSDLFSNNVGAAWIS